MVGYCNILLWQQGSQKLICFAYIMLSWGLTVYCSLLHVQPEGSVTLLHECGVNFGAIQYGCAVKHCCFQEVSFYIHVDGLLLDWVFFCMVLSALLSVVDML